MAKTIQFFVFMARITMLTDTHPLTNAATMPTTRQYQGVVICNLIASHPSTAALAKITGTDNKKENSAASVLLVPSSFIVLMVLPLRDSPGNTATPWTSPVTAIFQSGACSSLSVGLDSLSASTINTAVVAKPTGRSLCINCSGIKIFTTSAKTKVGRLATIK